MIINKNTNYGITGFVTASSTNFYSTVNLAKGTRSDGVFEIINGNITKSVSNDGRIRFETGHNSNINFLGKIRLSVSYLVTINLDFNANPTNINNSSEISFGGFYDIAVKDNSTFTISAPMNLISGSSLTVDNTSTLNVNHGFFIAGSDEYTNITNNITNNSPNVKEAFYNSNFNYDITKPSLFNVEQGANINIGTSNLARIGGTLTEGMTYNFNGLTSSKATVTVRRIVSGSSVPKESYSLKNSDGTPYQIG